MVVTEEGLMAVSNIFQVETTESDAMVTSTLTFQPSQSGVYMCRASNSLGNDTAQAYITVFGKSSSLEELAKAYNCTHMQLFPPSFSTLKLARLWMLDLLVV